MKFLYFIVLLVLINSCTSNNNRTENKNTASAEITDSVAIESEPEWMPFKSCLNNLDGYIYTKIQTDEEGKYFVVWVSYEWSDSTQIPHGSRNIKKIKDCVGIDVNFTKIGDIAHYDYLRNGETINESEYQQPQWSYIVPESEGDIIAKATKKILLTMYSFNFSTGANKLYCDKYLASKSYVTDEEIEREYEE